jgi:hypothetical protein
MRRRLNFASFAILTSILSLPEMLCSDMLDSLNGSNELDDYKPPYQTSRLASFGRNSVNAELSATFSDARLFPLSNLPLAARLPFAMQGWLNTT